MAEDYSTNGLLRQIKSLLGSAPSGGATSAKQDTIIGHVDGLEGQIGSLTEAAPATDTASSGLNGRLQRIAQRLTSLLASLQPSSAAGDAIAPSATTAAADHLIAKASAGNLYGFNVRSGVAGQVHLYDATSEPADGAVTPKKVYDLPANTTLEVSYRPPLRLAAGIVIGFSTTGPYTRTAANADFISADFV